MITGLLVVVVVVVAVVGGTVVGTVVDGPVVGGAATGGSTGGSASAIGASVGNALPATSVETGELEHAVARADNARPTATTRRVVALVGGSQDTYTT